VQWKRKERGRQIWWKEW